MNTNPPIARSLLAADKAYTAEAASSRSHHRDERWAAWCADYLLEKTDFQDVTKRQWTVDELAQALLDLQAAYQHTPQHHHWTQYFSLRLSE